MRGRPIPLAPMRRLVIDLVHFGVPSIPVERRMELGQLVALRAACPDRPAWTAIFAKAFALVARDMPVLRRAYVKLPVPRLYEYPDSSVSVAVEREHGGETGLMFYRIPRPDALPLADLSRLIRSAAAQPIEQVSSFRRAIWVSRLPLPLRRALWWLGLNVGRLRGNYFGTFGVSVYSSLGVESLHPISPLTTVINYGEIAPDGPVAVRAIYDHRVMDGTTIARALLRLEETLTGVIADELRALAPTQGARVPAASRN
jgi:hypothetical protein